MTYQALISDPVALAGWLWISGIIAAFVRYLWTVEGGTR